MHIRRLQIHGFKSFPEKTTFMFEPGISGIVGPNGCGKSNVVDALKWCLGEQSAKSLRGSAMQDVIFSGSDARKASVSASVALTFARGEAPFAGDFAHCDEVQISRSLKRDGSSDYLINQVKVRLKDIQDLFLDTGLNNRLYAIIEQGQIGQIINARPHKTRELFEEAAGISRFKQRKEEALANLGSTDDNLRQASLLVDQLHRQLRTLERQAKKAMLYRALRSRIRQLELADLFGVYIDKISDRRVLSQQLKSAESDEQNSILLTQSHEQSLKRCRDSLRGIQATLSTEKDSAAECEANRREYESVLQLQSREVLEREERIKLLSERRSETEAAIAQRSKSLADLAFQRERWNSMVKEQSVQLLKAKVDAKGSEQVLAEVDERLDRQKKHQLKLASDLSSKRTLQTELSLNQGRNEDVLLDLKGQKDQLKKEIRLVELEEQGLNQKLSSFEEEILNLDCQIQELIRRREEAEDVLRNAEINRAAEEKQFVSCERKLTTLHAQQSALEQMQRDYAGLDSNLASLLTRSDTAHLFADLLDVSEEDQAWVQEMMGPLLDVIVVETDDEVIRLGKDILGEAKMVSIQDVDSTCPEHLSRFAVGELGLRALNRLYGRAASARGLSIGLSLQRQTAQSVFVASPIVFVAANGVVQMGRNSPAAAVFERKRALETLDEDIDRNRSIVSLQKKRLDLACEKKRIAEESKSANRVELQAIQSKKTELRANCNAIVSSQGSLKRELLRLQQRERQIGDEIQKRLDSKKRAYQRDLELKREIVESGDLMESIEKELSELHLKRQSELQISAERQKAYSDLNAQLVGLKQRIAATTDQRQVLQDSQDQDLKRSKEHKLEVDSSEKRIAFLRVENETIRVELQRLGSFKERFRDTISLLQKQHDQAQHALIQTENAHATVYAKKEKALSQRIRIFEALEKAKSAAAFSKSRLETDFDFEASANYARLERDGLISVSANQDVCDSASLAANPELVSDFIIQASAIGNSEKRLAWREEFTARKDQLSSIGDVNLIALQEQNEIAQRYDALLKQQADLIASADRIRQSIQKLDQLCISQFKETYNRVNAYFSEIYPRLVGGGRAHLELTEPKDLLTTGVAIYAQPPGKRLQSLTLLSGGEKAMVAISLLFSLFRVKPSPFCVLDEVDAPLDEGNGARFNAMLAEMAEKSQFIVITHNKKTMEAADVLYGVSMISPGISSLVSTKME